MAKAKKANKPVQCEGKKRVEYLFRKDRQATKEAEGWKVVKGAKQYDDVILMEKEK